MNKRTRCATAMAAGLVLSFSAMAQQSGSAGGNSNSMTRPGTTPMTTNSGIGGSGTFSGWLSDYQSKNQGRVSRQAYMDEVGKRWDAADTNRQGLTTDQINRTYGSSGSSGSVNTTPGNMGPNDVKK